MLYFDHNATSPPKPQVLDAVQKAQRDFFGNPSSQHKWGRRARTLLEESRERLGALLGVRPMELVFTSGGTEGNRLAIEGALEPCEGPSHALVSAMEHPSVLGVYERLKERSEGRLGVTLVRPGGDGRALPEAFLREVKGETRIISLQHANNETGVLQPVEEVARRCQAIDPVSQGRRSGTKSVAKKAGPQAPILHVDAVQSLGKIPIQLKELGADLVTLSSHKVGGPKGAGALWVRPGTGYVPPLRGGPQERKMRPGTENLPAVHGFVLAVELAIRDLPLDKEKEAAEPLPLGSLLRRLLEEEVDGVSFNGGPDHVLPNTVNASFGGVSSELLVIRLDEEGVGVSTGSACASGSREPSHVLEAMGLLPERVSSAIRFSAGWSTRREDVEKLVPIVKRVVEDLRRRSVLASRVLNIEGARREL